MVVISLKNVYLKFKTWYFDHSWLTTSHALMSKIVKEYLGKHFTTKMSINYEKGTLFTSFFENGSKEHKNMCLTYDRTIAILKIPGI